MKKISYLIILSLALTIIAFWLNKYFFLYSLSFLPTEEVHIISNRGVSQFGLVHNAYFYLTIGITPIIVWGVLKLTKSESVKAAATIVAMMLVGAVALWSLRIMMLISHFKEIVEIDNLLSTELQSTYRQPGNYRTFWLILRL